MATRRWSSAPLASMYAHSIARTRAPLRARCTARLKFLLNFKLLCDTSAQRAAWYPMQSVSYLVSAPIRHDAGWAHPIRRACVCHIHINAVFCARIE